MSGSGTIEPGIAMRTREILLFFIDIRRLDLEITPHTPRWNLLGVTHG
jgi:hypothetical protein